MNEKLGGYYKALSNPTRLAVFMHVADKSVGAAPKNNKVTCVCEISDDLKIPQPTVSNHLKVLEQSGLVNSVKEGTRCYQYVTKNAAKDLLENAKYINNQAKKNPY